MAPHYVLHSLQAIIVESLVDEQPLTNLDEAADAIATLCKKTITDISPKSNFAKLGGGHNDAASCSSPGNGKKKGGRAFLA